MDAPPPSNVVFTSRIKTLHMNKEGYYKRFITYIMRLSGESRVAFRYIPKWLVRAGTRDLVGVFMVVGSLGWGEGYPCMV